MAQSLALIILFGLLGDQIASRLRLPGIVGMLGAGVLLGPQGLDLISPAMAAIDRDIRMLALIALVLRAGLRLKRESLNRVGGRAIAAGLLPVGIEALVASVAAAMILDIPLMEAAALGIVLAAISPAVVVPLMIRAIEGGKGKGRDLPTMLLAAASLDNAFVIVAFSAVLGAYASGGGFGMAKAMSVPLAIVLGALAGGIIGYALAAIFVRVKLRATKKTLVLLGVAVLLMWIEERLRTKIAISGLVGILAAGFILLERAEGAAHAVADKLGKIWVAAEILLFVLVGAQVDWHIAMRAGGAGALILIIGLCGRMAGITIATSGMGLTHNERVFAFSSSLPKATVQAAIGALPLAAGMPHGGEILAIAVLSIILTTPVGSWAMERSLARLD